MNAIPSALSNLTINLFFSWPFIIQKLILLWFLLNIGKKQGRNEFVIRLQPSEAMYMKLTVSDWPSLHLYTLLLEHYDTSYHLIIFKHMEMKMK